MEDDQPFFIAVPNDSGGWRFANLSHEFPEDESELEFAFDPMVEKGTLVLWDDDTCHFLRCSRETAPQSMFSISSSILAVSPIPRRKVNIALSDRLYLLP